MPGSKLIKRYPHEPDSVKNMLLISLWLGATLIALSLMSSILILPAPYNKYAGALVVILLVLPLPQGPLTTNPLHKMGYRLGDSIMEAASRYFGLSVYADDLDVLKKASSVHCKPGKGGIIIPLTPHDVLPYPIFAFSPALNIFGGTGFGREGFLQGLMTGILFKIPYLRHLYSYVMAGDVGKKNFLRILDEGGTAVFIPGGVQEVICMNDELKANPDSKKIFLYLNKRKGFVKLAILKGSAIVPCFVFGIDGSFTYKVMPGPPKLIEGIAKTLGFLPMLYFGRWGIPLGIAKPNKITVCLGLPILAEKSDEPSDEQIKAVHKQFCDATLKVFEENKQACGYGDREVVIV